MKYNAKCNGLCCHIAYAFDTSPCLLSEKSTCKRCDRTYKQIVQSDHTENPLYLPKLVLSKTGTSS